MKNNKVLYGIIGVGGLVVINLIVFLCVNVYTTARWINIAGLNLSVIVFWVAGIMTGSREEKYTEYARFPIVACYSIPTFLMSIIFIAIGLENVTVSIITQVVLFGLFAVVMCLNTMANNSARNTTNEDKIYFNKLINMSNKIETIMNTVNDKDMYKKIEKAYDSVKNANVTNKEDVTDIDNDIMQSIGALEVAVQSNNIAMVEEQVSKINNLIARRNQM